MRACLLGNKNHELQLPVGLRLVVTQPCSPEETFLRTFGKHVNVCTPGRCGGCSRRTILLCHQRARKNWRAKTGEVPAHLVAVIRLQSPFFSNVCLTTVTFSFVATSVFSPFVRLIAHVTAADGDWLTPLMTVCMIVVVIRLQQSVSGGIFTVARGSCGGWVRHVCGRQKICRGGA